jgi:hypothetical protein
MFLPAGDAPRRPDVEQPDLAEHVLRRELLFRARRGAAARTPAPVADQRRRHVARVEVEPDGEQDDEDDKADQRPEKSVHGVPQAFCASGAAAAADGGARRAP